MKSYTIVILLVSGLLALSFGMAAAQNAGEAMNMTMLQEFINATENSTMPQEVGMLENEGTPQVMNIVLSNVSLSIIGIQNLTIVTNNIAIPANEANSTKNGTELGAPQDLLRAVS
jgi:pimeloyl-CoA synthetase